MKILLISKIPTEQLIHISNLLKKTEIYQHHILIIKTKFKITICRIFLMHLKNLIQQITFKFYLEIILYKIIRVSKESGN